VVIHQSEWESATPKQTLRQASKPKSESEWELVTLKQTTIQE
jgi:hypothetical protein